MIHTCKICNKEFYVRPSHAIKGHGKHCSKQCDNIAKQKPNNTKCAWCSKKFRASQSRINKSKTGFLFCCVEHQNLARRIEEGIPEFKPEHYGDGRWNYRERALRKYGARCSKCLYDKFEQILEVHHIDGNRKNNSINNLTVLCRNCHAEYTFGLA